MMLAPAMVLYSLYTYWAALRSLGIPTAFRVLGVGHPRTHPRIPSAFQQFLGFWGFDISGHTLGYPKPSNPEPALRILYVAMMKGVWCAMQPCRARRRCGGCWTMPRWATSCPRQVRPDCHASPVHSVVAPLVDGHIC